MIRVAVIVFSSILFVGCGRDSPAAPATRAATAKAASTTVGKLHFEHKEFVLDLDQSWTRIPVSDPEQFQFESKTNASMLTISVMPVGISRAKMLQAAEKFLEVRKTAETTVDKSLQITFGDQWVTPKPDGEVVEIAYAGYDDRGRIFRFMGFVTNQKVVSFYCETTSRNNDQAKRIFDDCFRGFKFYVP